MFPPGGTWTASLRVPKGMPVIALGAGPVLVLDASISTIEAGDRGRRSRPGKGPELGVTSGPRRPWAAWGFGQDGNSGGSHRVTQSNAAPKGVLTPVRPPPLRLVTRWRSGTKVCDLSSFDHSDSALAPVGYVSIMLAVDHDLSGVR